MQNIISQSQKTLVCKEHRVILSQSSTKEQEIVPVGYVSASDAEQHLWNEFNKCYATDVRP